MLTVSRKGDYGLLLMAALADRFGDDGFVSLKKVTKEKKMPYRFVTQIALGLKEAGLLESKEGVGGGYRLTKKPKEISVGEVLKVLEGPVVPATCMREKVCVCEDGCNHKDLMKHVAGKVQQTFDSYSLADLMSGV